MRGAGARMTVSGGGRIGGGDEAVEEVVGTQGAGRCGRGVVDELVAV